MPTDEELPVEKDGFNADDLLDDELEMANKESDENPFASASLGPPTPGQSRIIKDGVEVDSTIGSLPPETEETASQPTTDADANTNANASPSESSSDSTEDVAAEANSTATSNHSESGSPPPAEIPIPPKSNSVPPAPPKTAPPKPVEEEVPLIALSIPNGSEGKPYDQVIRPTFSDKWRKEVSLAELKFEVEGLAECGIEVERRDRELHLTGTPNRNGDVEVSFKFVIPRRSDKPELERTGKANWYVNPDPRSLWKNIEPDPSLPYHKPHSDCLRVDGESLLVGASVRGRSHAHEGTFRDDDYGLEYDADSGWYLMTVCDGAGSAKFSRRGSQLACEAIRAGVHPHFSKSLSSAEFEEAVRTYASDKSDQNQQAVCLKLYEAMGGSAMGAFKAIKAEADSIDNCEINQFATTVIFTIAKKLDVGWFAGSFCVGDGGVAIYSRNQDIKVLNKPDGGEFAGQTRFITMSDIWTSGQKVMDRIQFDISDDVTAIIAMTDGVSDAKFGTDNNFFDTKCWHDLWEDMLTEVELSKDNQSAQDQLLQWLNFWSPGNHDDRTIALLLP